jgi:3-hydroxyisobutyrate dehydrogenase-like beta-hydroxyacid dehydrogenase
MSTVSIAAKERHRTNLAARGAAMLDCPLSGNPNALRAREAAAFVSGDADTSARARPVIEGITDRWIAVGTFGNGSRMKYLANMLVAVHCMAAAEVFHAGAQIGFGPGLIAQALNMGAGGSRQLAVRAPVVAKRNAGQRPGTTPSHSELPHISGFLHASGVAAPLFETARRYYEQSLAAGHGGQDTVLVFDAILRDLSAGAPRKQGT